MNDLEKRSFYSFVLLYVISSFLFIILSGFWYFTAQKSSLKSNDYFQMRHISDKISSKIIKAHMKGSELKLPVIDPIYRISLIDRGGIVVYGEATAMLDVSKNDYYRWQDETVLVSDAPQEHLGIASVVVRSDQLHKLLDELKMTVLSMMALLASLTVLIAWILSTLFMRPLHQRIKQIETFISDITHELNTPITALSMATERALKKETYDKKMLRNISISTKQLYDIYRSLTYLDFSQPDKKRVHSDLEAVLLKSITYYKGLYESKQLVMHVKSEPLIFPMAEEQASMLFGNLINNAIKYSMVGSDIEITLQEGTFSIKDHGIGIPQERIGKIFKRYERGTDYAGGFGVGLNIVKSICDDHDIKIDVRSKPEHGTVFSLTL